MEVESMDFEAIMKAITCGLTNNPEEDIKYLREQCEKYKDHEMATEIIRACGRLIFGILPDDTKGKMADVISKDAAGYDAAIDEVRFNIYKKDYEKAQEIMESLVKKYEELDMYKDDQLSEYHNFTEPFEEVLYRHIYNTEKDLRQAQHDYAGMYLQYGSLLFELQKHKEAVAALEKAIRWNPVNAAILFEHAENFRVMNELEMFADLTRRIFSVAYKPADLARCYRNMAYYCVEKEMYQEAICCNIFSLQYDKSDLVQSELFYIMNKMGTQFKDPDIDEVKDAFEKINIPLGADKTILGLSYSLGKKFYIDGNYEYAKYFLNIFDKLIDDNEVKELLAKINTDSYESIDSISDAIHQFVVDDNGESYRNAILEISKNTVWIPCNAVLSEEDQKRMLELIESANGDADSIIGESFQNSNDIRLIPDILQKGEDFFFPVFSSPEAMGEYGESFSKIEKYMNEAVIMAINNEKDVAGIVVNAFTEPFIIEKDFFNFFTDSDDEEEIPF